MRVASGLGAQYRDGVAGRAVPFGEELRCAGVEEDEPGMVGRGEPQTGAGAALPGVADS